ncbi:glycoprotein [Shuangao Bedbug Virus 2]|uniref:glycoprotein n=1 Tax=Shuangao Bedbug Virus 2 TaxID=1608072 RepID=UPI0005AD3A5E|nr:glycoprotein [Shuangao Bedbug Virus 2]AJG39133.1 glycoprotein [Shuangao Bedbug Virus 2]
MCQFPNMLMFILILKSGVTGQHPKLSFISHLDKGEAVKINPIPQCKTDWSKTTVYLPGTLMVLRPNPKLLKSIGLLATAFTVKTKCEKFLFSQNVRTTIYDSPIPWSSFDDSFIRFFEEKYTKPVQLEKLQLKVSGEELMGQDLYSCGYYSGQFQNINYIKFKAVETEWDFQGNLLSPIFDPSCLHNHTSCVLKEDSKLYFPMGSPNLGHCEFSTISTLAGFFLSQSSKISSFVSHNSAFKTYFDWSLKGSHPRSLCHYITGNHYITLEGHVVRALDSEGRDIFIKSQPNPLFSQPGNHRIKRSEHLPLTTINTTLSQLEFPKFPPPSLKFRTSQSVSRSKRSYNYYNYPARQREQMLYEHSSWTLSELEFELSLLHNESIAEIQKRWILECKLKNLHGQLARSVLHIDPRPYIAYVLSSQAFITLNVNSKTYYISGDPVWDIEIYKPYKWCNGSLYVHTEKGPGWLKNEWGIVISGDLLTGGCNGSLYVHTEKGPGWLKNEWGIVISGDLLTGGCTSNQAPEIFLFPTMRNGSWDLISNRSLSSDLSLPSPHHLLEHGFYKTSFEIDTSDALLRSLEAGLSSMSYGASSRKSAGVSLWKIPDPPSSWYESMILHFLTPTTMLIFGLIIFLFIWRFLRG